MARNESFKKEKEYDPIESKNIAVRRVTKVVKGGRTMRFSAVIVSGNKDTNEVGFGMGKAVEVPSAIEKATAASRRAMFKVSLAGTTIPYAVVGVYGRGRVILMPAEVGTGVIAGGAVRAVLEAAGIKDIRTKSIGTNNAVNSAKATIAGLQLLRTPEEVAALRGKQVKDILDEADLKKYAQQKQAAADAKAKDAGKRK